MRPLRCSTIPALSLHVLTIAAVLSWHSAVSAQDPIFSSYDWVYVQDNGTNEWRYSAHSCQGDKYVPDDQAMRLTFMPLDVPAPTRRGAIVAYDAGAIDAGRKLRRTGVAGSIGHAHLPPVVAAPADDGTVTAQSAGVLVAQGQCRVAANTVRIGFAYLPIVILAPAAHRAVETQSAGVKPTGSQLHETRVAVAITVAITVAVAVAAISSTPAALCRAAHTTGRFVTPIPIAGRRVSLHADKRIGIGLDTLSRVASEATDEQEAQRHCDEDARHGSPCPPSEFGAQLQQILQRCSSLQL